MYTNFGLELLTINPSLYEQADKASMLDEIIDYVKFLQLQVKVLSMSRLGAPGAVLPLLRESQTEVCSFPISLCFQTESLLERLVECRLCYVKRL
jgi:hypothetical protein